MRFEYFPISFDYKSTHYTGKVVPYNDPLFINHLPKQFKVTLEDTFVGVICCGEDGWKSTMDVEQGMIDTIGDFIEKCITKVF